MNSKKSFNTKHHHKFIRQLYCEIYKWSFFNQVQHAASKQSSLCSSFCIFEIFLIPSWASGHFFWDLGTSGNPLRKLRLPAAARQGSGKGSSGRFYLNPSAVLAQRVPAAFALADSWLGRVEPPFSPCREEDSVVGRQCSSLCIITDNRSSKWMCSSLHCSSCRRPQRRGQQTSSIQHPHP